jgi:hypothetical protein
MFEGERRELCCYWMCLETKLLEEPLVLAALVFVFEAHADLEAGLLAFDWVFQVLHSVFALETDFWDAVASGHEMVVVHELKRNTNFIRITGTLET